MKTAFVLVSERRRARRDQLGDQRGRREHQQDEHERRHDTGRSNPAFSHLDSSGLAARSRPKWKPFSSSYPTGAVAAMINPIPAIPSKMNMNVIMATQAAAKVPPENNP
jgi:hypothetical protein